MSVEQVESAILNLRPEERLQLITWLDAHRSELFGDASPAGEFSDEQLAEIRRRRAEYRERRERFIPMDKQSLQAMFDRIRDACARVSSPR